jgi:transcriptional regulator with XRE-family HTH domain
MRHEQGVSQLDLSLAAGVSSRHISFIETGRAQPSRTMVLRLGETLDLSLRHRNALLEAAGFAPGFPERALGTPDLTMVRHALELVLKSHEPFPAFVLDRSSNVLMENAASRRLRARLLPRSTPLDAPVNVVELVLDPSLLRPRIANWPLVAHVLGHRLRRQLHRSLLAPESRTRLERLLSQPDVVEAMEEVSPPAESSVVIPIEMELDGVRLSWFSTIATLGTPQDVTLDELQIESLFPADEETERFARRFA